MENTLPHTCFNGEIYEWSLRMKVGVWVSAEKTKMDKQEFINAISYLIACGEPLLFNNEMTAITRIVPFDFEQHKINVKQKDYEIEQKSRKPRI